MSAAEHLAQYGVSFQQARDFIHSNLNSPQVIYNVAAQYGVTFEMLGELYADGVSDITVKNFFAAQGFNTTDNTPTMPTISNPDTTGETDTSDEEDTSDETDTPDTADMPDLSIDELLDLSDETLLAGYDWDSLISEYQAALSDIDWSTWSTTLESALAEFDWEAWASEIQAYANILASDDSWITELESYFGNTDFDDLFDDSAWEDITDEDISDSLDDINWDDYSAYLEQYGFTEEQFSSLISQAFDAVDWDTIMNQLMNFDWQGYADMLAEADFSSYLQNLEDLYSNMDFTNSLEILGTNTAFSSDFALA